MNRQEQTQVDTQSGIICGSGSVSVIQVSKQSFRPVEGAQGVYTRVTKSGVVYWARVLDPVTGTRRWVKGPTKADAVRIVRDSKKTRDVERAQAYHNALEGAMTKRQFASLFDVLRMYPEAAAEQRAKTGSPNEDSSRHAFWSVDHTFGDRSRTISIDRFPDEVEKFIATKGPEMNKSTLGSLVSFSRCITTPWAMRYYSRHGLNVPETLNWAFVKTPKVGQVYHRPPEELIARTLAEGRKEVESGSAIGRTFLLCYCCAMAAADASRAQFSWLLPNGAVMYRRAKTGRRSAPRLDDWTEQQWRKLARELGADATVIPKNTEKERWAYIEREFSDWMIRLGWTSGKKAHELRKLAASQWMAKGGPVVCCEYTGDTLRVLMNNYVDFIPDDDRARIDMF